MSETVADHLLQRLAADWGVKRIYGYPGDGINGIMGAFGRGGGQVPEFIQVRHEEMAAFMACAHAKFTGEAGVCLATSGPGAIHLLNGLYDAKLDHQPVVAIVGQQARLGLGGNYQQEVDLTTLFKDVAHEYVQMATEAGQIRHLVDRAMRIALSERTCHLRDRPQRPADGSGACRRRRTPTAPCTPARATRAPRVIPDDEQLRRAAEVLNAGERVAMLIGAGALHAADEVIAVADTLGAGVAKALLGKAAVPDDLPFVTGSIGLLGTRPSWDLMQDCDTLLMVGSSFPYSEFLPEEGRRAACRSTSTGGCSASATRWRSISSATARSRSERCCRCSNESRTARWREKIEQNVGEWWQVIEERAHEPADPINPQLIFHELSKRLPDGAILTSDSGSAANWYARDVRLRAGMMASLSGTLATMGPGVPYAIAREVRASRPARDRLGRRRRDADERARRADHDRQVPRALVRPAADRARAQQPRSQPGDVGAARDVRRPEVRRVPGTARRSLCRAGRR